MFVGQWLSGSRKKVGLIGGLAPRAGIYYYERLLELHARMGAVPEIMLNHADVDRVLSAVRAGDTAGLGAYLGTLADALFDGGSSFVAVTAVAPHMAIKAAQALSRGPLISVLDIIEAGIRDAGFNRVAIFGNRTVIQTNVFGAIRPNMVVEMLEREIDAVHCAYTDIAVRGKRGTDAETKLLSKIAEDLFGRGADAVVLAGTDLSSFYADEKADFPHIDVSELHLNAIMRHLSVNT